MRPHHLAATLACAVACVLLAGCGGAQPAAQGSPGASPSSTGAGTSASPSSSAAPTTARARFASWRLTQPSSRQALVDLGSGQVLLAGGMLPGDVSTDAVSRIDLASGRSTRVAHLAVPVHDAAGGLFAGAPAVFGGGNSTEQSLVQALHGGAWHRVARFPTTRSDLSVVTTPSGTVAIGGYDGTTAQRAVFEQQGHGPLRPAGRLVRGVRYAATALVGGAIYVFGGEVSGAELSAVQRIDPRTGHTRVVATLPRPLGHAMAVPVGGRVLLMGGHVTPDVRTDRMWWFDPATNRFTSAGRLPRPVSDAAIALDGTRAWLLGGEDPGVTDRVVEVDLRR